MARSIPLHPAFPLRAGGPITVSLTPSPGRAGRRDGVLDTRRALGPNEVERLVALLPALSTDRPWRSLGPRLALYAGLQAGEIAHLRTNDLRWRDARPWLTVRVLPRGRRPGHERTVPVHSDLEAFQLSSFFNQAYFRRNADGPLFPELANAQRPGDAIDSWLRRAVRPMADDGLHAPTMHDLRMTCAQSALDGGASAEAVEVFLGQGKDLLQGSLGDAEEATQRGRDALKVEAMHAVGYGTAGLGSLPTAAGGQSARAATR